MKLYDTHEIFPNGRTGPRVKHYSIMVLRCIAFFGAFTIPFLGAYSAVMDHQEQQRQERRAEIYHGEGGRYVRQLIKEYDCWRAHEIAKSPHPKHAVITKGGAHVPNLVSGEWVDRALNEVFKPGGDPEIAAVHAFCI